MIKSKTLGNKTCHDKLILIHVWESIITLYHEYGSILLNIIEAYYEKKKINKCVLISNIKKEVTPFTDIINNLLISALISV